MCFAVITGDDSLSETVSKLQNSFNVREIKISEIRSIFRQNFDLGIKRTSYRTYQKSRLISKYVLLVTEVYVNEGDISDGNTVAGPFQGLKPFNGPWSSFLQLKMTHTMSNTI